MQKLSLADRLAKKAFEGTECQKSWAVHMAAFGPILEHAFEENYQARVHLTAALNLISSRQLAKALPKLKQLQKYCETDADKCAFLFFFGVYAEMSGDQENMAKFYAAANEYGHRLPLPYLKVGKYCLENHDYEPAYENYRSAIDCYTATGLSEQERTVLGAAYTNLATCLMMMHRYEEAQQAVATSCSLFPDAPGRAAVEASLHALRGDVEKVNACLETLKTHTPQIWEAVKESTDKILEETDPLFFPVPLEEEKIQAFWQWFASYSDSFRNLLDQGKYEQAMTPVGDHLLAAFPFLEEAPYVSLGKNETGYVLELKDCYAVGITHAYEALLEAMPPQIGEQWQFFLVH